MGFKFEKLEVWQLSLEYIDLIYEIAEKLPKHEQDNLKAQLRKAATSVSLNIAEGSTGQSDAEQARFLRIAIGSLIETVACQHIIYRRAYLNDNALLRAAYKQANTLVAKLQAMRNSLTKRQNQLREALPTYEINDNETPFI